MTTLNKVIQMKNEGKSDNEIMAELQNEGVSPSEINDSINQAKIKNAVISQENHFPTETMQPSITERPITQQQNQQQPSQKAIQPQAPNQSQVQPQFSQQEPIQTPTPNQSQVQPQFSPSQPPQQQYQEYQQQEYYPETPQSYSGQDYYAPQESYSAETISEIATQIATEILDEYKTKVGDMLSFKNKIQNKVEDLDDRLKRIENSIDKLQQSIIGKIGEFGDNSAMIHKDLDNLHGTVAKLMNPLIDNINALEKHSKKKSSKK